ncbi:hybrid sensor histidine kinase/response regulator transcription factor [Carboxylicivirga marina]|uniref:histidine kinase n=1 Tax=Carboxylicivirga marina TaxID=2800988 RepID=A0ABS1HHS3_9BACT|nr:two-component regulator propeller domain-containing protein [Carboxylicivirga marina]MBK3517102.1 response regulator [Carboxylicivirga marina]
MSKKDIRICALSLGLLLIVLFSKANTNLRFEHLDLPSGINSTVKSILEDADGFLWFGTSNGLAVYDAYQLRQVEMVSENAYGSFGAINALVEDRKQHIWIGTETGIFIYDKNTEISVRIDDDYLKGIQCRTLYLSVTGDVFIGTADGFYIYDQDGQYIEHYLYQQELGGGLSHNMIRCFYEDKQERIWIGTFDGLNCLNRKEKKVTKHQFINKESQKKNNLILSIQPRYLDSDSILLIGTETGLCIFNSNNGEFKQYKHSKHKNSLSNNVIKSICVNGNDVWMGTDFGLNLFKADEQTFYNFFHDYKNTFSIANNVIHQVYVDSQNNLWLATDNGIDKMYLRSGKVLISKFYETSKVLDGELNITGLSVDNNGDVWLSTREGLVQYNKNDDAYHYHLPPALLHNKVSDVLCDKNGMVWITTAGGLNTYDGKNKQFKSYVADASDNKALKSNYIHAIARSKSATWFGSYGAGLHKVVSDEQGELSFYNFRYNEGKPNSINSNRITDVIADQRDNVWVATNKGLNKIDELRGVIKRFNNINNSENQYVADLFVDSTNTLWMAAYHGLLYTNTDKIDFKRIDEIQMDIQSVAVKGSMVYFVSDNGFYNYDLKNKKLLRIPNADLGVKSILHVELLGNDKLVLYGKEGFVTFKLDDVEIDSNVPEVRWTNFSILSEIIKPFKMRDSRYVINQHINKTENIELKYGENTFRIDFSSLQYSHVNDCSYKYMLDGYDEEWRTTMPNQAYVSYTQVRPGRYTLKVQASNKYGLYNDNWREIAIRIKPPLYLSVWAIIMYIVVLMGLFILSRKLLIAREKANNDIRFQTLQRQKSEELIEIKTRFFTNISHELKTPLTLISSPIDDLLSKEPEEPIKSSLLLVKRNTDRLKKLVNQILDIRKIEKGGEKLLIQEYDIIRFCDRIIGQFKDEAERRSMLLQYNTEESSLLMWFDMEKMEKVLVNLLSNAFKFTPDGGRIRVEVKDARKLPGKQNKIVVAISDDGCGISKHAQTDVFDRFNTQASPNYSNQQGTGIGLSLVKEYVTMHGGEVKVESEPDDGSCFIFTIPLDRNKFVKFKEQEEAESDNEETKTEEVIEIEEPTPEPESGRMVVLVVEDDSDMRDYIVSGLKEQYKVLSAENGVKGHQIALKEVPDIIISDWMMPQMNGIELCQKIKGDLRTCHIPLILLTAKGGLESKTEGIETGADDYIQKPFSMAYLKVRIKNLWQQRERLKAVYQKQTSLEPSEVTVTSLDEKFLADLMELLEKDMDNPELNVKSLSEKMGMSHTNLYRKVKALTGQTATEFIRTIRLKRAAQLLKSGQLNVSEVMYMVGFSHRSYFTQSFKAMYGVSPKEYK